MAWHPAQGQGCISICLGCGATDQSNLTQTAAVFGAYLRCYARAPIRAFVALLMFRKWKTGKERKKRQQQVMNHSFVPACQILRGYCELRYQWKQSSLRLCFAVFSDGCKQSCYCFGQGVNTTRAREIREKRLLQARSGKNDNKCAISIVGLVMVSWSLLHLQAS